MTATSWRATGAALLVALLAGGCSGATLPHPLAPVAGEACFDLTAFPPQDQALADTLLARGLDNEALFTLWQPLKPMSSIHLLRGSFARSDALPDGTRDVVDPADPDLATVLRYQRVAEALQCGEIRMVVVPYRATQDSGRSVQISVIHRGRLDEILARDQAFWGQWGIGPGSDPAVVVTVIEFESPSDRHRGYGYLFGYPEHAVSFFTEAGRREREGGDFVRRDFFQIPVHSQQTGRFVYAVPEGHEPGPEDEAILHEAAQILAEYRRWRPRFENPDGTLRAVELLKAWYRADARGRSPSDF